MNEKTTGSSVLAQVEAQTIEFGMRERETVLKWCVTKEKQTKRR